MDQEADRDRPLAHAASVSVGSLEVRAEQPDLMPVWIVQRHDRWFMVPVDRGPSEAEPGHMVCQSLQVCVLGEGQGQ
jgi:hypothetical protein